MEKQFEIGSLEELDGVANYICELAKTNAHFCFNAQMGAGKTTLINLVCKKMGVKEHTSSPTYSIVNEYLDRDNKSVFHFDLYRIEDEAELLDIGMIEILDSNSVCFIEWPEKTLNFIPGTYVEVSIVQTGELRTFKITS